MDENTESNRYTVTENQASIDKKKNANSILYTLKAIKIRNDSADRTTVQMTIWRMYIILFQYQT